MPGWCRLLLGFCLPTLAPLPAQPADRAAVAEQLAAAPAEAFPALFESAIRSRSAQDNLPEPYARIAVRRDLAQVLQQREAWLSAAGHLEEALHLAERLDDVDILLQLHLDLAEILPEAGRRDFAYPHLDAVDALLHSLDRPELTLRSALLRTEILASSRPDDPLIRATYERLLRDDRFDPLAIRLHWARRQELSLEDPFASRWEIVRTLARQQDNRVVEAEALDQLGYYHQRRGEAARAAEEFLAASNLVPVTERNDPPWDAMIAAFQSVGDTARIADTLDAMLAATDPEKQPARVARLLLHRANLREAGGDLAAAYQDLKHALGLRDRSDSARQFIPATRILTPTSSSEMDQAATLAATRAALRETELARTRLERRQAYGITLTAALVAALLGLAYVTKRRTAAALAVARDNAELRAERTHWQMLRYQLNPHFLFNALSSLGGLVTTDTAKAARCVDRLSEFCHLALAGAHDELRTLGQELELLHAYLDVEQAGAEDLRITIEADPAVTGFRIPPLLLQPLAENALKYGAQTSENRLEVRVTAGPAPGGHGVRVEVTNTGHWVEPDHQPRRRAAIGLANVRERLARLDPPGTLDYTTHAGRVTATLTLQPNS